MEPNFDVSKTVRRLHNMVGFMVQYMGKPLKPMFTLESPPHEGWDERSIVHFFSLYNLGHGSLLYGA